MGKKIGFHKAVKEKILSAEGCIGSDSGEENEDEAQHEEQGA